MISERIMSMSPTTWRYEFIATHSEQSKPTVLDGANFTAIDADNAKLVLARVVSDLKLSGPPWPHAIRLLDPDGWEVWRGLLAGARPVRRDGVPGVAATAPAA
jgi:hypothetical protein